MQNENCKMKIAKLRKRKFITNSLILHFAFYILQFAFVSACISASLPWPTIVGNKDFTGYTYRKKITITNTVPYTLDTNYVVKLSVDTIALQKTGGLQAFTGITPDRKDWRILYWNGLAWTELDRYYVPDQDSNYNDITLDTGLVYSVSSTYFRLQTNILTGAIDENYYIYYGNSKETEFPQKNLDKIFVAQIPNFTRGSSACQPDDLTEVGTNTPRFTYGKYDRGILLERYVRNYIINTDFETDLSNWNDIGINPSTDWDTSIGGSSGRISRQSDGGAKGSGYVRLGNGTSTNCGIAIAKNVMLYDPSSSSTNWDGKTVIISWYGRASSTSARYMVGIRNIDSTGSNITSSAAPIGWKVDSTTYNANIPATGSGIDITPMNIRNTKANTWERFWLKYIVPTSNVRYLQVAFFYYQDGGGSVDIDCVQIEESFHPTSFTPPLVANPSSNTTRAVETLYYPITSGNFNRDKGTLVMWVKPEFYTTDTRYGSIAGDIGVYNYFYIVTASEYHILRFYGSDSNNMKFTGWRRQLTDVFKLSGSYVDFVLPSPFLLKNLDYYISNSSYFGSLTHLDTDGWIFLAYTWGSEGAKIFVNSDYQASSDANSMKSSIVGDYSNGMYFAPGNNNPEAIISDVAIYDRVLTDAEIRAIYSRTYQPLCLFDAVFFAPFANSLNAYKRPVVLSEPTISVSSESSKNLVPTSGNQNIITGNSVVLNWSAKDEAGNPLSNIAITITITRPDKSQYVVNTSTDLTGLVSYTLSSNETKMIGFYIVEAKGTGLISQALTIMVMVEKKGGIAFGPNPFTPNYSPNNKVVFSVDNAEGNSVSLKIFNLEGALIREDTFSSSQNIEWTGVNSSNTVVESGIHIWQIEVGNSRYNGTVIVAK